jgi:hypothetical protein
MLSITDYTSIYKGESRDDSAIPGDTELSYGAFVSALIKVSNLQKLMEETENTDRRPASKVVYKEYGEYQIPDAAG